MIFYLILTYFALRSAQLLYRNKIVGVLGINLSDPSFDSGSESAPYQLTLADDAGSPDPTQVDYNNGANQWSNENTYTPEILSTGTYGYNTQSGIYIETGRRVLVQGRIILSSASGQSGTIQISLPHTLSSDNVGRIKVLIGVISNVTSHGLDDTHGSFASGGNNFLSIADNSGSGVSSTNLTSSSQIDFSIEYIRDMP